MRWRGDEVLHQAVGQAQTWSHQREMRLETLFDLASLTKPLVTAAVALVLADRGALALDEDATTYVPELRTAAGTGLTFRRLLAHSSGLAPWHPLYLQGCTRAAVLAAVEGCGLAYRPGSRVRYSDLGFIVLGIALERIADQRLDDMVRNLVLDRCGLRSAAFLPDLDEARFAATERGNAFERDMVEAEGLHFSGWRDRCYSGQVNDGNAHYGMGGVSGNAGLFATAQDGRSTWPGVAGRGHMTGQSVISAASVRLATTNQSPDGEPARGLGWVLSETGAAVHDQTPMGQVHGCGG